MENWPAKGPVRVRILRGLARWLARGLLRLSVRGTEQVPLAGGLLLTTNHLSGADPVLVLGFCPRPARVAGKAELLGWPVVGWVARVYGMIPLQRDRVDRPALRRLLQALAGGEAVLFAPEGRESRTGALEAGRGGAAFLAQHAGVPIVPVAITGTTWRDILSGWRRLRRPCVTLTFGRPYRLPRDLGRAAAVEAIMLQIAALLPPAYRGVYAGDNRSGGAAE